MRILPYALSDLSNHHHDRHDLTMHVRDLAGLTLVISPLLSLMRDQVKGGRWVCQAAAAEEKNMRFYDIRKIWEDVEDV